MAGRALHPPLHPQMQRWGAWGPKGLHLLQLKMLSWWTSRLGGLQPQQSQSGEPHLLADPHPWLGGSAGPYRLRLSPLTRAGLCSLRLATVLSPCAAAASAVVAALASEPCWGVSDRSRWRCARRLPVLSECQPSQHLSRRCRHRGRPRLPFQPDLRRTNTAPATPPARIRAPATAAAGAQTVTGTAPPSMLPPPPPSTEETGIDGSAGGGADVRVIVRLLLRDSGEGRSDGRGGVGDGGVVALRAGVGDTSSSSRGSRRRRRAPRSSLSRMGAVLWHCRWWVAGSAPGGGRERGAGMRTTMRCYILELRSRNNGRHTSCDRIGDVTEAREARGIKYGIFTRIDAAGLIPSRQNR